jgi:hypothetical protein
VRFRHPLVRSAVYRAPSSQPSRAADLLRDGLALLFTERYAAGTPMLRRALRAFSSESVSAEGLTWLWLASATATAASLWDDETWHVLSTRRISIAREAGALTELPMALSAGVWVHLFAGELDLAAALLPDEEKAQLRRSLEEETQALIGALELARDRIA